MKRLGWKKHLLFVVKLLVISSFHTPLNSVTILIHGTFAVEADWCRPGGKFYDELEAQAATFNEKVIPFAWPGKLNDHSRIQGAEALAKVILSYPSDERVTLIGHSHGGNVINLASKFLSDPIKDLLEKQTPQTPEEFWEMAYHAVFGDKPIEQDISEAEATRQIIDAPSVKKELFSTLQNIHELLIEHNQHQRKNTDQEHQPTKSIHPEPNHERKKYLIDRVYFLATPVDERYYQPAMSVIEKGYNLYSQGDYIQQVLGIYKRLYARTPRIVNFRVTMDDTGWFFGGDNPTHAEMHEQRIAQWLLAIPEKLSEMNIGGFENYSDTVNGKIHLDAEGMVYYKRDKKTSQEREEKENRCSTQKKQHLLSTGNSLSLELMAS